MLIKTTFAWRGWPYLALANRLRMRGWPLTISGIPGADFKVDQLTRAQWLLLYELSHDNDEFKIEPWTKGMLSLYLCIVTTNISLSAEMALAPGSIEAGEIPIIVQTTGTVLMFARDVAKDHVQNKTAKLVAKNARLVSQGPPAAAAPFRQHHTAMPLPVEAPDIFQGYKIVGENGPDNSGDVLYQMDEPEIALVRGELQQDVNGNDRKIMVPSRGEMGRTAYRRLVVPAWDKPYLQGPGVPPPSISSSALTSNSFYQSLYHNAPPPSARPLPPANHPSSRVMPNGEGHRAPSLAQSRSDAIRISQLRQTRPSSAPTSTHAESSRMAQSRSSSNSTAQQLAPTKKVAYRYRETLTDDDDEEV